MKISHGLLSIALLVSVAQMNANCDSGTCTKDTTTKRGCCADLTATKCAEGCTTDEEGNCICDEKCGCNKPNKAGEEDAEEVLVCEDCEQEVNDEGKCGCNKPNKRDGQEKTLCVGCGEERTEKGCSCSSSCGCSSCCK